MRWFSTLAVTALFGVGIAAAEDKERMMRLSKDDLGKVPAGWKAEKAQTTAVGSVGLGASQASRSYSNPKGQNVEIQITGDSAMVAQFAAMMANPQIAGAMGKIVRVGNQRGIQNPDGDVHMVVANKVMIVVSGSADAAAKLSYAQAVDVAKLPKM